ncbi:MAG: hypothetical protein WC942_00275 [Clostridia bacterium]|jgi:hypothetical protein
MSNSLFFSNKKRQIATYEETIKKYDQTLLVQKERIEELKTELKKVNADVFRYKAEEENIKLALKNAVEKATQIENNAKALYSLEIERLKMLYKKWEQLLNVSIDEQEKQKVSASMSDFAKQANAVISQTFKQEFNVNFASPECTQLEQKENNSEQLIKAFPNAETRAFESIKDKQNVRLLLEKMFKQASQNNLKSAKMEISTNGYIDSQNKNVVIRKPNIITKTETKPMENLGKLHNNPSTINDSGFNLKEALNPIGDLEEIMQGFDFFDEISD